MKWKGRREVGLGHGGYGSLPFRVLVAFLYIEKGE